MTTLWELPPAQPHSPTSQAAAVAIAGDAATLRERVYEAIAGSGGLTDEQVQDQLGMPGSTERPRRVELQRAGRVRDSGTTRRTRSGRAAVVWIVTN